jgi:hypothetical protein
MRPHASSAFLVLVLVAACARGTPIPTATATPTATAIAAAHAVASGEASLARNARCEVCHAEIAREWRGSLHQLSGVHPVYRRAFAREPLAFCTRCHAPEAAPDAPDSPEAAAGAACVTCHRVTDGGAPGRMTTAPCATCHEFPFEDGTGKMQLTSTEHRASKNAATSCEACHMTRIAAPTSTATSTATARRSHAFAASRDPAMLRRAARITARRDGGAIVVRFEPAEIGHALPTGDIFRRLRVAVQARGDGATKRELLLGRKTKQGPDRDDRPFRDGRPAEVRLPFDAPGRPVAWRVVYERVDHPRSLDEADAAIDGAIELASGELAP